MKYESRQARAQLILTYTQQARPQIHYFQLCR
jgi:hypothetical protein